MVYPVSKWFIYAPVAIMPLLAGAMIGGKLMQSDLVARGSAALSAAESGWASLVIDGRDARISGEAPDEAAVARAVAALSGVWGIRKVDTNVGTSPAVPGIGAAP